MIAVIVAFLYYCCWYSYYSWKWRWWCCLHCFIKICCYSCKYFKVPFLLLLSVLIYSFNSFTVLLIVVIVLILFSLFTYRHLFIHTNINVICIVFCIVDCRKYIILNFPFETLSCCVFWTNWTQNSQEM